MVTTSNPSIAACKAQMGSASVTRHGNRHCAAFRGSFANVAKTRNDSDFTCHHHVRRATNAVHQAFTAAILIVELVLTESLTLIAGTAGEPSFSIS